MNLVATEIKTCEKRVITTYHAIVNQHLALSVSSIVFGWCYHTDSATSRFPRSSENGVVLIVLYSVKNN